MSEMERDFSRSNVIESVRQLGSYTLKATEARVKLNQNESPWDLPAEARERIMRRVEAASWNRYPDFHPEDVLQGIGELHGVGWRNVLIGNGSNELIQALMAACVGKGDVVALPTPTFTLYAMMVAANEGSVQEIPLTPELNYDLDAWRTVADEGKAHLLLCSPNNPTGSTVSADFVAECCMRTQRLVIVDEAYVQFGDEDVTPLISRFGNLVVLRTFSKALGLAGVRLGYALGHPDLVAEVSKVKLPYNVGIFGLEVAREALAHPELFARPAQALRAERERVATALEAIDGLEIVRGMANFLLIRTEYAASLFDVLFAKGILVRDVGRYPMLAGVLRASVGTPEQNDELIAEITAFMNHEARGDGT